ncbi:unnamed protein product [Paramecium octaurelia]|uniref:Uncharacterized protein n=1 Tax=Paramecium octaurelia TaxID=43137 RepID=A0A8S1SI33_PAROT|nr:unnamed protein product [Paramecium octaurelia]
MSVVILLFNSKELIKLRGTKNIQNQQNFTIKIGSIDSIYREHKRFKAIQKRLILQFISFISHGQSIKCRSEKEKN